eukprot:1004493-Rhodomonas_salina.1
MMPVTRRSRLDRDSDSDTVTERLGSDDHRRGWCWRSVRFKFVISSSLTIGHNSDSDARPSVTASVTVTGREHL